MFHVIDKECRHTVVASGAFEHAEHQARYADLAGYPTTIRILTNPADVARIPLSPPQDCGRCWDRVGATVVMMRRQEVIDAAAAHGIDPFYLVEAFERCRRFGMPVGFAVSVVLNGPALRFGMTSHPARELRVPDAYDWSLDAQLRRTS